MTHTDSKYSVSNSMMWIVNKNLGRQNVFFPFGN